MTSQDDTPAIAVIPYRKWPNFNLGQLSLDELIWPLGRPNRLADGHVKDMRSDDHLITFPRKSVFLFPRWGVKAKISVAIIEPDAIHQKHLNRAKWLSWRFYKVLTKNAVLLKTIHNGIFYYFGSTFIQNPKDVDCKKTRMASLIASAKRQLTGHKLRHKIVDYIRSENLDVDVRGRGYKPFVEKQDGLASYRYSVVIENVQEPDYFSEKLVDACLCETVPIYWGAPNIADYFYTRGMILCATGADIQTALEKMDVSDYETRLKWIKKNKRLAETHADYHKRATLLIRESLKART